MSQSCLAEKLGYYLDLDDDLSAHIAALEEKERVFPRHREIVTEGDAATHLHAVKKGWLYKYIDMPDGRRQIVKVLLPGDIIGFPDLAFTTSTTNLRAAEEVVLCPFPKRKLDVIFKKAPKLAALLMTVANRDMACLMDTLKALGRMSAEERIYYFFLDIRARLKITNRSMTDTFRMPLNQQEIGDVLGLTHTYVSKSLRRMEEDGTVWRGGGTVRLLQAERMIDTIDFVDRYSTLDTSWFEGDDT